MIERGRAGYGYGWARPDQEAASRRGVLEALRLNRSRSKAGAGLAILAALGLLFSPDAVFAKTNAGVGTRDTAGIARVAGINSTGSPAASSRATGAGAGSGVARSSPGPSGAGAAGGGPSRSEVPNPKVTGPISGGLRGYPYDSSLINLASYGYTEQEYFISGTATAHGGVTFLASPTGIPYPSGTTPAQSYTTRILVRRPIDPSKFNGTVLFEWLNVTSGVDIDLDWATGYREIMRDGYAWVGVSAQPVGASTLRAWDPVRYATLSNPGDPYSFDIYSQAVQAVRHPEGIAPLGKVGPVTAAIADGHSQSGSYLHTYVNLVQNQANVIDGFLIRGDGNPVFDFSQLKVPVFQYMSETEVNGVTAGDNSSHAPDAPDSRFYTLWQVAGPAHQDNFENTYFEDATARYWTTTGPTGNTTVAPSYDPRAAGNYGQEENPVGTCQNGISTGIDSPVTDAVAPYNNDATSVASIDEFPQQYTVDAAIFYLNRWIRTGTAPPSAPRITLDSSGTIVRDQYGNAVGGLRLPVVDVPVATYNGSSGCSLSGETFPLNSATLAKLYPTHADYVADMEASITKAEAAGFLLPFDAADLLARAEASSI